MFPNGPKWSYNFYYKFNWIAFTTRLNLVLVWSKIVQILTKSHPIGSGTNQVSWSSFLRAGFPEQTYSKRNTTIHVSCKLSIWVRNREEGGTLYQRLVKTRPGDLVGAGPNWVTFWSKFGLF